MGNGQAVAVLGRRILFRVLLPERQRLQIILPGLPGFPCFLHQVPQPVKADRQIRGRFRRAAVLMNAEHHLISLAAEFL